MSILILMLKWMGYLDIFRNLYIPKVINIAPMFTMALISPLGFLTMIPYKITVTRSSLPRHFL